MTEPFIPITVVVKQKKKNLIFILYNIGLAQLKIPIFKTKVQIDVV